MNNLLQYNNFLGSVSFSSLDDVFHGRIEGINDLVTFEGSSVKQLKKAFKDAVNDYLILCKEIGKDPYKSFKGSFNVRVSEELHSKAYRQALVENISLNQFVKEAIVLKLLESSEQNGLVKNKSKLEASKGRKTSVKRKIATDFGEYGALKSDHQILVSNHPNIAKEGSTYKKTTAKSKSAAKKSAPRKRTASKKTTAKKSTPRKK